MPSLDLAKQRMSERLPRDPATGLPVARTRYGPRLADFEFLGLGVSSYVAHLHRLRFFFMLLALLSVSSLVANGYGGELAQKQLNLVTWLFTGASLGNAAHVAPAYGATELLISTLLTGFLYYATHALREEAHRVEQKQVGARRLEPSRASNARARAARAAPPPTAILVIRARSSRAPLA